ncbi:MAG: phosphopantothenoylcysteine decarboxylase [Planctomycetota bacterium]
MKILVTAGPTREMIDEVRFLSNMSSGRTGYAIAEAAHDAGHEVNLVSGPVALSPPIGLNTHQVVSARDMLATVSALFESHDALIMTAAVCDYRPAMRREGKVKKAEGNWALDLVRNPDILATVGNEKGRRVLIGFALEVDRAVEYARGKLEKKNLDLIVVNQPENFARGKSRFRFLTKDGLEPVMECDKRELGEILVKRAEDFWGAAK